MNPSERIAARIVPNMDSPRMRGYAFDPVTVITVVVAVVRLLIALWGLFGPDHARRRLEKALDPRPWNFFAQNLRRQIAEVVREQLPDATEVDVDAVIKGLADCNDQDLIAVRIEAREGTY